MAQRRNDILGKQYALEHPLKERNWKNYEKEFPERIKKAMRELDPLVKEAVSAIHTAPKPGHTVFQEYCLFPPVCNVCLLS